MINELENKLIEANKNYREGKPSMSDAEFDSIYDELYKIDPNNQIFLEIGIKVNSDRKRKLPITMASMDKIKTVIELQNWIRLKGIDTEEYYVLTPKYDGLSLCVDETHNKATTRGDGEYGQASDEHYKHIKNKLTDTSKFKYTYGEVMMRKETFINNYSTEFANPRNFIAGLMNNKKASDSLSDTEYIKYGAYINDEYKNDIKFKHNVLDILNESQYIKVPYKLAKMSEITEDLLISLFREWSSIYEIDGIILEVDSLGIQEKLGRERSGNPCWARAFKSPIFEESAETKLLNIQYTISKNALLKPVGQVSPINIGGVVVSNVTLYNARYVKDNNIGVGSIIRIARSGGVIPKVVDVILATGFEMPDIPNIGWNENCVELMSLIDTDEQKIKKLVAFFEILEVENFSEGVITQLWNAGHKTIKDILNIKPSDMESIEGFGKRKSNIVYEAIQSKINNIPLSKLQHATGIFKNLGSKKLALLEHFDRKPSLDEVLVIDGFAETSAKSYIDNYDAFFDFIKDLPVSFKNVSRETLEISGVFSDMTFVFTGIRRSDLEKIIESKGGKIGSSVSKNTTYLIMKEVGTGSSKEKRAIDLRVKIITVEQLEYLIKES